jgi:nitroreductase
MTVLDCIRNRYSVRSYTAQPVTDAELETVLDAGRMAQSAKNFQEWRFVVVRNDIMRQKLVPACRNQGFVAEAPVVIACCGTNIDYVMTCGQHAYALDLAIAMENMHLVAYELGLGTCWLGAFFEDQVKELLGIPREGVRIVGLITLGHTIFKAPVKNRKSLDEIIMQEHWKG